MLLTDPFYYSQSLQDAVDQCLRPFTAYAMCYFLLTLFHMIDRIHEINAPEPDFTLKVIHRVASPVYGK